MNLSKYLSSGNIDISATSGESSSDSSGITKVLNEAKAAPEAKGSASPLKRKREESAVEHDPLMYLSLKKVLPKDLSNHLN